ncbi:hypothetical protein [Flavobacterium sp. N3904]|uniref:hypothetical protein n=1 Tax=Flavobacterium sp. N3904 TaxID=2986835 RepID=UPI0022246EB4|nr:hypothetical protein [Flavobacterium sp. N3904]
MRTHLNNCPTCANTNTWLNLLTSNNVKFNYVEKEQVKTIQAKAIEAKSKDALPTNFNNFYCGPEKNGKTSNVNVLTKYLGIKNGDKTTLKTDFISTTKETLYNGFQLSLKIIDDDVSLIMKGNSELELKCWTISRITFYMKKKNSSITENNVRTLLLDGSLKVKFCVSVLKDHGTLWRVYK